MPSNKVQNFNAYRSEMNAKILDGDHKIIKRIFNLDTNAYKNGYLPVKTKELLGLVASASFVAMIALPTTSKPVSKKE